MSVEAMSWWGKTPPCSQGIVWKASNDNNYLHLVKKNNIIVSRFHEPLSSNPLQGTFKYLTTGDPGRPNNNQRT